MFNKNDEIIYVSRDSIKVFTNSKPFKYSFSFKDLVKNLAVLDPEKFINEVSSFFTSINMSKSPLYLFISEDIYFQEELKNLVEANSEIESFLANIPFSKEELISMVIRIENKPIAIVLSKSLIDNLKLGISKANLNLKGILFLSFAKGIEEILNDDQIKNIVNEKKIISVLRNRHLFTNSITTNINLKENTKEEVKKTVDKKNEIRSNGNGNIFYIVGLIIALVILLATLFFKYII